MEHRVHLFSSNNFRDRIQDKEFTCFFNLYLWGEWEHRMYLFSSIDLEEASGNTECNCFYQLIRIKGLETQRKSECILKFVWQELEHRLYLFSSINCMSGVITQNLLVLSINLYNGSCGIELSCFHSYRVWPHLDSACPRLYLPLSLLYFLQCQPLCIRPCLSFCSL